MELFNILITIGIAAVLGAFIYIGRKLQTLDDLNRTSQKIKTNLKVIGDHLTRYDTQFNPTELQSFSPYQLTDAGKKMIGDMGFDDVFANNKDDFFGCIDDEKPKFKYDVETAAIQSVFALSDQEYMNFLKIYFYNNPKRNLQNTAPTLGVYIRDKYLEAHPEITQ